jgi:succinylarginine dihydrolase
MRCQRPTTFRRDGRPICLRCRVVLTELEADKKMRRMGKLKGTHGRS